MRAIYLLPIAALLVSASGCYRTVVDTGREASRVRVKDEWVMGFASGLFMPGRVDAARRCPNGVARVVTEASFANLVVQTLTAGLLSPRSVEVTCAASGRPGFGRARGWGDGRWGERRHGPGGRHFHHHHHHH
jgi:hypothetical protein